MIFCFSFSVLFLKDIAAIVRTGVTSRVFQLTATNGFIALSIDLSVSLSDDDDIYRSFLPTTIAVR